MPRLLTIQLLILSTPIAFAGDPVEHFEKSVRPVLVEQCQKCHGADPAKEPKGGLNLMSRAGLLKGGDSGPAVVPGEPAKSRLIEAIRYGNSDLAMPPKSKLPEKVIRDLEQWVRDGAVWPGTATGAPDPKAFDLAKRKSEHWCWRPLVNPTVPTVADPNWNRNPIDAFIRSRHDTAKLNPNPPADPATLLRRLSFDLTGLPPTAEDADAFARDPSRYAEFVDKYLASPQFGERWARHWLDLVRYAETRGHEFDHPIPNAWRYRDYVIRAFNRDLPFRDFVTEHIAGDRIENPRRNPQDGSNESIQGTGFWLLGEEVHSPVDIRQDQADRFDNRIDVFGKTFLGLTIACARCHDHKFDAISTKDYYALYALLEASSPRLARIDDPSTGSRRLRDDWQTDGPAYRESANGIESILSKGITLTDPKSEREPGELHKYDRAGRILRSPNFTIESGQFHVLMKGSAVSYAAVGHHTLIAGPLHGRLVRELKQTSGWRWEQIDLTAYRGLTVHFEFSPLADGEFAIARIDQADAPPAVPMPVDPPAGNTAGPASSASRLALALWEGPPLDGRVFVRGSPRNLGEAVPPRFLEAISGAKPLDGGRLHLARILIDPQQTPLLYRVFANRLWHHLFGRGIVASVDNFGVLGEAPSDPELLDWLATQAITKSPKELIRTIVLSQTYRMSSRENPESEARDPGNRLFHRQNLRRLEAEAIRDAMLHVSGRLDRTLFGPSVPAFITDFQDGRGKPASGPLDGRGRRSIYIKVQRNFLNPMQLAFDAPIPFSTVGKRQVSNVPAQALILLNDDFVNAEAKRWGERHAKLEPAIAVERMYRDAFARPPTEAERTIAETYFRERGPAALAHVLLNVKEFTYLP